MTVEIHHKDGHGDVAVTTRDKHTVDASDMICAWNETPNEPDRMVKFPRENVVRVVVLDGDETTLTAGADA